jgi:quercetin dioxygenase-like cupin family protein
VTEEALYVVEGALGLWLDDRADVRPAGSYVDVPAGVPH